VSRKAVSVASVLLLACVMTACGGRTITARELATIMPSAAAAPLGTQLLTAQSGPKTLDEFVSAEDVRTKLRALGFDVAYVSTFSTRDFPADPSKAPVGATLYGTFAVLVRDASAAHDGYTFYVARSRARAAHLTPILIQGFGDDATAFRFSSLDQTPLPGIAYLWRVDNALFSVVAVGNPEPDPKATRTLAGTIDSRAKR